MEPEYFFMEPVSGYVQSLSDWEADWENDEDAKFFEQSFEDWGDLIEVKKGDHGEWEEV